MIRTERRLRLSKWLIGLILCFIWGNSLLPGEMSDRLSNWVKDILILLLPLPGQGAAAGSGLLRKIAHFSEFAALGACLCWRFGMLERKKIMALAYGFGAACVDETIQAFVPERGPGLLDVAIDTCGTAAGIALLLLGHNLVRKYNQRRN